MPSSAAPLTDPLRPTEAAATAAWAARVRDERRQMEQLREVDDPADFYAPMARRFGQHPQRTDDPSLEILRELAEPDETWLDIGAGGGRYALPLALIVRRVNAVDCPERVALRIIALHVYLWRDHTRLHPADYRTVCVVCYRVH